MSRGHDGRTFRYQVDATSVVRFDASGIDPLAAGYELVLSTCWPFDALTQGPERYLVHATMTRGRAGFALKFSASRYIVRGANGAARATRVATSAKCQ